MKFSRVMLLTLLLLVCISVTAVSASDDLNQDNLTLQCDIPEMDVEDNAQNSSLNDEDVLGMVVSSEEDGQNGSGEDGPAVLSSGIIEDDITIKVNTKTIDTTKGNTVLATIKVPKGTKGTATINFEDNEDFNIKLSKIPVKNTKKGFTTYSIRLKDLKGYDLCSDLKKGQVLEVNLLYNNKYDGPNTGYCHNYLVVNVNKKAKTFKLRKKIETDVWIGPYDWKSGKTKKITVHLETWKGKHPVAHKKVKITINGVVYIKKTNSKGLIKLYPPKYLPPKDFVAVIMEFAGDDKYTSCMTNNALQIYKNPASSKSKIKAGKKTFSQNQTKKYTVKLLSKGKAIKKAKLKFNIAGKKYSAKTNSKGFATFKLSKLNKKGNFKGTVLYMGDRHHYMSYKKVKLAVK